MMQEIFNKYSICLLNEGNESSNLRRHEDKKSLNKIITKYNLFLKRDGDILEIMDQMIGFVISTKDEYCLGIIDLMRGFIKEIGYQHQKQIIREQINIEIQNKCVHEWQNYYTGEDFDFNEPYCRKCRKKKYE